ncbi:NAD-dependent epimerase/dehydratase family protein [Streptomyces sp. PU-14G]|uniref:NAD-dependent epimerase/dehydratase family protein n=1 Tax=Streptomyces sp. PU-14G TaxID=2800808 RepID=UPI0034DFDB5C
MTDAVTASAPDVIVHGATVTHDAVSERRDPERFVRVNVLGTTHVLDAARRTGSVRRACSSSAAAHRGDAARARRDVRRHQRDVRRHQGDG